MNHNEGRAAGTSDRHPLTRRAMPHATLAALSAAAALAAWWFMTARLFAICAPAAQIPLLAAGIMCAALFACVVLLLSRQRGFARPTPSEARLNGIIRATTEAIVTVDSAQRIVMFNPMAERVFRCRAADALGAPLSRFIPERYRAAHEQQVRQFGETGVSERRMGARRVLHGLRADGEEFPVEASISQIEDGDGTLFTVILRDVTERVEAEGRLTQSREELRALSANLQSVREQEKSRVARELHDDLGQTLSALKMDVSALQMQLAAHDALDESICAQLRRMLGLIDRNIASLRRIAAHQRPAMLDDLGLCAAIDWLVDDFVQRHGIEIAHGVETGDLAFSADAATAVFRIIEEALCNVVRHAHASRVELSLKADDERCVLRVGDNGAGAAALPARNGKAFGLLGVRERANALGGSVFIDSMPENGFVLTVVLPREAVREKESQP